MRYVRLVSFQDQVSGETGLGFKGHTSHPELICDWTGTLIAHDIVEHQQGLDAIGCVRDELIALGAVWQVRGRHGFPDRSRNHHSPEAMLAGDLLSCAVDLDNEGQTWVPSYGRLDTPEHDYDEEFLAIIEEARPMIRREMDEREHPIEIEAFLDNALHLFRIGFRKAERRWGERFEGLEQYTAIRDAVKPFAKDCEVEGREYVLGYGLGRATCREYHEASAYAY